MNIADLVVIIVILLFGFLGYRRGLLMGIYSIGAYFIAIFLGFILRKPVVAFLNKTPLHDKVYDNVYQRWWSTMHPKVRKLCKHGRHIELETTITY